MHLHDILSLELARFGNEPINIVETGSIRKDSDAARLGDGWSTEFFAGRMKRAGAAETLFWSIDLDVSVAKTVLTRLGLLDWVFLVQNHSLPGLANVARNPRKPHVVFLDSDNDPDLIFYEFLIAREFGRSDGSTVVMIDDVRLPGHPEGARKGERVLGWLSRAGQAARVRIHERTGWNGYKCGVLAIDV